MLHALLLVSMLVTPPAHVAVSPGMLSATDKTFLNKAAMANNYELMSARIAMSMATSEADKKYAQMVITDHTKLAQELTAAIAKNDPSFKLPTSIDAKEQNMLDALKKSSAFAADYKKQMISSHDEIKGMFKDYTAKSDANADVKGIIVATMPVVDKHIAMANSLPMM